MTAVLVVFITVCLAVGCGVNKTRDYHVKYKILVSFMDHADDTLSGNQIFPCSDGGKDIRVELKDGDLYINHGVGDARGITNLSSNVQWFKILQFDKTSENPPIIKLK